MKAGISLFWLSCALGLLCGCGSSTLPDPNEPPPGEVVAGEILLRNINGIIAALEDRVRNGEISPRSRDELLKREVRELLTHVDPGDIPAKQKWQYGDAYRLAGDWKTAKKLYEEAVQAAVTVDRRVNDSLRLARAQAHLGDVTTAIATCRGTFTVQRRDKAPILMAVLYEVAPEALGKGQDKEVAQLIEDAINQHEDTVVDALSDSGRAFLIARPLHVHNAWIRVARIYQDMGLMDEARRAIEEERKSQDASSQL